MMLMVSQALPHRVASADARPPDEGRPERPERGPDRLLPEHRSFPPPSSSSPCQSFFVHAFELRDSPIGCRSASPELQLRYVWIEVKKHHQVSRHHNRCVLSKNSKPRADRTRHLRPRRRCSISIRIMPALSS
ncbi:hypothetical protein EYF80_048105 [Liparis tanakae]|uniref:Uncharacterized protein n=1 Tax=Liparis tanakae TaxID=230148 RepID=A0A4Z2FKE9_9TELE|nr:hypothetical protein EYF80_048105 [Liparis tanakae]